MGPNDAGFSKTALKDVYAAKRTETLRRRDWALFEGKADRIMQIGLSSSGKAVASAGAAKLGLEDTGSLPLVLGSLEGGPCVMLNLK